MIFGVEFGFVVDEFLWLTLGALTEADDDDVTAFGFGDSDAAACDSGNVVVVGGTNIRIGIIGDDPATNDDAGGGV
ncbi:hypothetical protein AGMMS49921_03860 [Endomicrobiia bacterium]|nr:hypothetical protein AGMMS49921_03860 [Endomicrobiia bacterium]